MMTYKYRHPGFSHRLKPRGPERLVCDRDDRTPFADGEIHRTINGDGSPTIWVPAPCASHKTGMTELVREQVSRPRVFARGVVCGFFFPGQLFEQGSTTPEPGSSFLSKKPKRKGSVLLFSLMIMGVVTLMTQQLIKSVSVGSFFSATMVHREQAEMLALGGINVAIAQLQKGMRPDKKKQEQLQGAPTQQAEAAKKFAFPTFIREVLPHLERWQVFPLTEEKDGIEGEMHICISCEEGKIPVQALYDEKKGDMTPTMKALFKPFGIKKKLAEGAMTAKLGAFFKKRRYRVNEVSALAPIAQDTHLPLWYEPVAAVQPGTKAKSAEALRDIALQNLFTTWNKGGKVSPLLLSDSVCAVMKLRRPQGSDVHKRKANYEELAKKYVPAISKGNEIVWKTLQGLWETKPKLSKELLDLFSPVVEPRFFSVLSCGKVAGVKQTALAILERVPRDTKPAQKGNEKQSPPSTQKKAASKPARPLFKIRRVYWV